MNKVMITGGAGFIGQRLVKQLLGRNNEVIVIDNLTAQVHGNIPSNLEWLHDNNVEFVRADVRCMRELEKIMARSDTVVHFASETGTGQSMYEITKYADTNILGTTTLIESLHKIKNDCDIKKIILASSRAVYGEGSYICEEHGIVNPGLRKIEDLSKGLFNSKCPYCKSSINLISTSEEAQCKPTSTYGITKLNQEQLISLHCEILGKDCFSLRYQNVYGPGQSLKNPYTGVLSVFSNLARAGNDIDIYEDGEESRDFIYVDDVVDATVKAIEYKGKFNGPINIGSGENQSIFNIAQFINEFYGNKSRLVRNGFFRVGDIRHSKADIQCMQNILKIRQPIDFYKGLERFLCWVETQPIESKNYYQKSIDELKNSGVGYNS